jgi:hypothetical protein
MNNFIHLTHYSPVMKHAKHQASAQQANVSDKPLMNNITQQAPVLDDITHQAPLMNKNRQQANVSDKPLMNNIT